MRRQEEPDTEWRVNAETLYAAGYIFYGRVPELGEVAPWGRARRPEDEARPAAWVEVVVILSIIGTYFFCILPDYLAAVKTAAEPAATALALLPTCSPIAHGPPACYDWERPALAPLPGNASGDSEWNHNDDEKTPMVECFSGVERDTAAMTTGTALALLPTCLPSTHASTMCYEWERPVMAPPPGSGYGHSDWTDHDDEKAAMECFYGLVRDATRTCDEWERKTMAQPGSGSGDSDLISVNDNKFTMECFYALAHDAAKTCFGNVDPPPT